MSINQIVKVSHIFKNILKQSQQVSLQAGDIADAFPQYFPPSGQSSSPLTKQLDEFLSKLLPADVKATITFTVRPGFKLQCDVLLEGGNSKNKAEQIGSIKNFLALETKNFTPEATARYKNTKLEQPVQVFTYSI